MPRTFTRFLVIESLGIAALNAGMNAVYTSYLWADRSTLPLGGSAGIGTDLATTPIVIAFLSILFGTAAIRKKLADGKVTAPARLSGTTFFRHLPNGVLARSATMAIFAALLLAAPLYTAMMLYDVGGVSFGQGVSVKVIITIVYSLLLVPLAIGAAAFDVEVGRPAATRRR